MPDEPGLMGERPRTRHFALKVKRPARSQWGRAGGRAGGSGAVGRGRGAARLGKITGWGSGFGGPAVRRSGAVMQSDPTYLSYHCTCGYVPHNIHTFQILDSRF